MSSNRYVPVVIGILVVALVGSLFVYSGVKSELSLALLEADEVSGELAGLQGEFSEATELADELFDANAALDASNAELDATNSELEARVQELEEVEPIVVVEAGPEIVLDISGGGVVKNVILMIGDGVGVGQLTAAEIENGDDSLVITSLPYMSMVSTHSSSGYVTDSAAAATALATGFKARNGVISLDAEWDELRTVVEAAEELGLSTGLVTNTRVTHATPASFMAHVSSRDNEAEIARQALDSGVDVLLGGGSYYFNRLSPEDAGYLVVESTEELLAATSGKVLGLFSTGYMSYESVRDPEKEPSLAEMTGKAIELLGSDPDGFFLMVEGGRIDHASHDNDYENAITETLSFDASVLVALNYASTRNDTLVIVTSDHETGGLSVLGGTESSGVVEYGWIDDYHTGNMVPVYAFGPRAVEVIAFSDNTDIGMFLFSVIE